MKNILSKYYEFLKNYTNKLKIFCQLILKFYKEH